MRTLLLILVAGCSYTFDDSAPQIRLVGKAPNTDGLPRLNHGPASNDALVLGYDDQGNQGAFWIAFTEDDIDTPDGKMSGIRAVRLTPPEKEEVVIADDVTTTWTRFFLVNRNKDDPKAPPTLTLRAAGQTTDPVVFQLPGAPGFFGIGYGEEAFIYWVAKAGETNFYTFRSDGTYARMIPIPDGIDAMDPKLEFYWSDRSHHLIARNPNTQDVLVHSTLEEKDFDLGPRPRLLVIIGDESLLACGDTGLRWVKLDATGDRILDPMPCDDRGSIAIRYVEKRYWVYYGNDEALLRVPYDGSGPPELVLKDGRRPLAFLDDGRIMYSKTPRDLYVNSAGDGWLDGWKFMERGLDASVSADKKRVRWLEHAAKPNASGELLSAPIGGSPLHLSLNTRQWEELADGRILCDANHAFRGIQNRIQVVDEKMQVAQWVADAASSYTHIPGTNDLLVDVVTGPTGYDIVRVPIPPPFPSPAP